MIELVIYLIENNAEFQSGYSEDFIDGMKMFLENAPLENEEPRIESIIHQMFRIASIGIDEGKQNELWASKDVNKAKEIKFKKPIKIKEYF